VWVLSYWVMYETAWRFAIGRSVGEGIGNNSRQAATVGPSYLERDEVGAVGVPVQRARLLQPPRRPRVHHRLQQRAALLVVRHARQHGV